MKKKFSLILSVMLVFICCIMINTKCVKAAESDFVIGTHNLNDTDENSAKKGDKLKEPEKNWKRYDDTNENFTYEGDWNIMKCADFFNGSAKSKSVCATSRMRSSVTFKFSGTKLRIIGSQMFRNRGGAEVIIDNIVYTIKADDWILSTPPVLMFEKLGLENKTHEVQILIDDTTAYDINNSKHFTFDAIDIDENGELKPYEEDKDIKAESISLDKSSLSLLEGKTEKLTATVKPDEATNKKVTWASSDENIAKIDENGNVTAIKEGQAIITAMVENTDLTATCKVNVTKPIEENKNNAILSISLVNGANKEYDVSMEEVENFINWYEERANGIGKALYCFNKKINPYESVKEYIAHDKIVSFEVKEYKKIN